MSQVYLAVSSSPSVPTQFTLDQGVAIPVANNLNVNGVDATENNDNGIFTRANPDGSDNAEIVLSNRITGTTTTTDATPATIITFPLSATPGVYSFEGIISAFDATDVAGGSYFFESGIRSTGASAIEIGTNYGSEFEEAAMITSDFNVVVSGNNVNIEVQGIAAKTIRWDCFMTYRFRS